MKNERCAAFGCTAPAFAHGLCERHNRRGGHNNRKLNASQVIAMRAAAGSIPRKELYKRFDMVASNTVGLIIRNKAWRCLLEK